MKASVLYKWLTYSAIAISILLCLFMLQAGLKGNFRSVDAFQAYIRGFGLFAPFVFVFIQAFQVVVPVLPGFIGCVAGALLFGSVCGFVYNYVGICAGSIIAFFLAKHFGISETSLKNYFRGVYGRGYSELLNEIRMKKAAELILNNSMKISQVSDAVGFATQSRFAKAFKNYYGAAPLEYKRKHNLKKDSDNLELSDHK